MHKWYGDQINKEWAIYTDSSFKDVEKINEYPSIKKHLDKFKKVITTENKPYGLHRSRNPYFFQGEKIIVARKCAIPTFSYVDFDSYVSATFNVIKTDRVNQIYLTGLLNSRLVAFWLKNKGKMQGGNYQIDKEPILEIPILIGSEKQQKEIISIVDKILEIKKSNPKADISNLEDQIDNLVYKLYGLNGEEIKVIEAQK